MYATFNQAYAFNQHLSRWDVSSVTNMRYMFYTPTHSTPCRWAGTHPKSRILLFCSADAWNARFRAATTHPPRWRVDSQGQRVRRVLSARQRRRRLLHRHPRERHVLHAILRRRVRAAGRDVVHRPGTDEWLCASQTSPPGPSSRRRWTRASAINCAKASCPTGTCRA